MVDDAAAAKARVREHWNSVAAGYDIGVGAFRRFGARLVEAAGVEPDHRILDVATGRGAVLFPAAERVGPSGEVTGIDMSPEMVRLTRADLAERGLPGRVLVMDAQQLDFADASFDRVLCGFAVMFFPDQRRGLTEFRRVLRAGGRAAVSTWRASFGNDVGGVLRDLGLNRPQPGPGWITEPEDLRSRVRDAGFEDVHVSEETASFVVPDFEAYWESAIASGMRRYIDELDDVQRQRVRASLAERLRDRHGPDGIAVTASALFAVATR